MEATIWNHLPTHISLSQNAQQQERSRLGPDAGRAAEEGGGGGEPREERAREEPNYPEEGHNYGEEERPRASGERSGNGGDRSVDRSRSGVDDRSGAPRSARVPRGSAGSQDPRSSTARDPAVAGRSRPIPSGSGSGSGRRPDEGASFYDAPFYQILRSSRHPWSMLPNLTTGLLCFRKQMARRAPAHFSEHYELPRQLA